MIFSAAIFAFGVACLLTYLLARPRGWFQVLDHPNERSLHTTPLSRTGGLAILAGALTGVAVIIALLGVRPEISGIAGGALVVGIVSFIDDRSHVPVAARLTAHLVAGALLIGGGLGPESLGLPGVELDLPMIAKVLLGLAFIVWMINLYNFMDGMDGFAGGMALIGLGTLGVLGYVAGDHYYALVCWTIAAAAGGFLVWNFPPARIFMGDTGASVLGLVVAALSLLGDRLGLFPFWMALLVFSPFIVDATVTLIRRAIRGERIWQAHRSHYYQRLVQLGWGHRKTVIAEYALMAGCAVTAVGLLRASPETQWAGIAVWGVIYAVLLSTVDYMCARQANAGGEQRSDII